MSLPVFLVVIVVIGLGSVLLLYTGRLIKFRESIPFFDWPPHDRMPNRAGFLNWIGTGLVIEGYISLLAVMLLIATAMLGHYHAYQTVLYIWIAVFVVWLLIVAAGTRRYSK